MKYINACYAVTSENFQKNNISVNTVLKDVSIKAITLFEFINVNDVAVHILENVHQK